MYLVDTSVLINFFKGIETKNTLLLEQAIGNFIPFGISALTYQEILQGAKNQKEFDSLEKYLSTQTIYYPSHETFRLAATIFFDARRAGKTIRSSIDCIIMATAHIEGLALLSDDRDFEQMVISK